MSAPLLPSKPENQKESEASNAHTKPSECHDAIALAPPTSVNLEAPWSVEAALSHIPYLNSHSTTNPPLTFFHLLERLKTTKREGWRQNGIESGESISDHMYCMSIITMLAPRALADRIDIAHCTKMALVHDMAELLVGDITPMDKIPKAEKARREAEAMEFLCCKLLGGEEQKEGADIKAIFEEYEKNESLESRFVHDVDKVELLLQMVEYERQAGGTKNLGQFAQVAEKVELEEMKGWCREILKERVAFWKGIGKTATTPTMLDLSI